MTTLSLGAPPAGPEEVKRRRRTYVVVGVAVAVLVVAGFAAARQPESTVSATPGYRDVDRPIDTSPFELAGATERGTNTTIAGLDGFADAVPTTPPTTAPPPLPPAATSTTLLPVPELTTDDLVCKAYVTFLGFVRDYPTINGDPGATISRARATFAEVARQLELADPTAYATAIDLFRASADRLAGATTIGDAEEIVAPLVDAGNVLTRAVVDPIITHAQTACPALNAFA